MASFSDVHAVVEQLQTARVFLERPIIQGQIAGFLLAVCAAAALSKGLWMAAGGRLLAWGRRFDERGQTFWTQGTQLVRHLVFPLLCFAATALILRVFEAQARPNALLLTLSRVFWLLLLYRLIVAVCYLVFGEEYMRRYQTRLLTPLFTLFILARLLRHFIALPVFSQWVVFRPFEHPITFGSLFVAPVTLYILFFTSRAIQDMVQNIIVPRTDADPNVMHAVLTLSRYIVIAVGVVIIAASLGVNMATVAFISGVLSVGIGFGMQQIIANFLSGVLLLFEQTLRPGDVIDINGEMGVVENLSIRATTMRTPSNVKIIVPNQSLLGSSVKTYTKRNRWVRVAIPFFFKETARPEDVREMLLKIALKHDAVRKEPKPSVYFKGANEGASGWNLEFQLSVWIDDPLKMSQVSSELRFSAWDAAGNGGLNSAS